MYYTKPLRKKKSLFSQNALFTSSANHTNMSPEILKEISAHELQSFKY